MAKREIKPAYEEWRENGCGYARFDETCRVCVDISMDLLTMTPRRPTINWSCIGTVSIEAAERFVEEMQAAIAYAKERDKNGKA